MPKGTTIVIASAAFVLGACAGDSPVSPEPSRLAPSFSGGGTQQIPSQNTFINAPVGTGHSGAGVKVLVIDKAYPAFHPDLPVVDAAHTLTCSGAAAEENAGHGAAVVGVIAAVDDDDGVVGIAPDVEIYFAQVREAVYPFVSGEDVACAIDAAYSLGIRVVNMSIQVQPGSAGADVLESALATGAGSYNMLFIASAGNVAGGQTTYPASDPNVIGVAGADASRRLHSGSTAAPNSGVAAAYNALTPSVTDGGCGDGPDGTETYALCEGSSYAAPAVAATAAIVIDVNPALTNSQVATILRFSTPDSAQGLGRGIIDATMAAEAARPIAAAPTGLSAISGLESIALSWANGDTTADTRIEYRQLNTTTWQIRTAGRGASTYNLTQLARGKIYEIQLRHIRNPLFETATVSLRDTTYSEPAPTWVQVPAYTTNSAIVQWANGDAGSGTTTEIQRRTNQGAWTTVAPSLSAGISEYEMTGLAPGTPYEVRVRHYNLKLPSATTSALPFTTGQAGIAPLAPPTSFAVNDCIEQMYGTKLNVKYVLDWTAGANPPAPWTEVKQSSSNDLNAAAVIWRGLNKPFPRITVGPFLVAPGTVGRYLWIRHIGNGSASSWQQLDVFPLQPADGCSPWGGGDGES